MRTLFKTTKRIIDKNLVIAMRNFQPWCTKMFWNVTKKVLVYFSIVSSKQHKKTFSALKKRHNCGITRKLFVLTVEFFKIKVESLPQPGR